MRRVVAPPASPRRRVARMPSAAAVDSKWGKLCRCREGDNWRFEGGPLHCPSCGARLRKG